MATEGPAPPTRRAIESSLTVTSSPADTFEWALQELADALYRLGISVELRTGGRIMQGDSLLGSVAEWSPGTSARLTWDPAPWEPGSEVEVRIRCVPDAGATRLSWELLGCERLIRGGDAELIGWTASTQIAPALQALSESRFGDWFTDRRVRRPAGRDAETMYQDPTFHWPNFLLILDRLQLTATDRLLEVGCGGGAFLRRALESGCSAVAIDHSPEMVRTARQMNGEAVRSGRARILEAEADRLPVADGEFTCAVSTGVFGFLPDPEGTLREMHRALRPGGRMAVFTGTTALRGTPACPEPMASRIHFYEDAELRAMATRAGFPLSEVQQPPMRSFAERAGLAPDVVEFFDGLGGAQLLLARKAP